MILYVLLIFLLILIPSRLQLRGINDAYLSKDSCNAIKGIFILLIFASHFVNTYGKGFSGSLNTSYQWFKEALGQCVVAHFLFYSGYGVMYSAAKKGAAYLKDFPRKRILHTLLVYDCAQILFLIFRLWRGKTYNIKQFVSGFLAWTSFGSDCWYIFVILGLYLISWLALQRERPSRAAAVKITVATLGFMLFLICAKKGKFWYNTALCYPLGVWFFVYQEKIEAFLKKDSHYYAAAALVAVLYVAAHKFWHVNLAMYNLTALLFALVVVLATMKFQVKNPILRYCGAHLQGLFLLHRLPMLFLSEYPFFQNNLYLFFGAAVALTFLLEFAFYRLLQSMKSQTS